MKRGLVDRLSSVNLALWLLGILAVAMAVATIVPQRAPVEVYEHALGHLIGPLVFKSTLRDVYGAWWFIGAFALLALGLLACSVKRTGRLLRQVESSGAVSRSEVRARAHWSESRAALGAEEMAGALSEGLRRRGYAVKAAEAGKDGAQGFRARRGKVVVWGPVVVHIGMVIVLLGAAYGRLPAHSYRTVADLDSGESYEVQTGGDTFSVRLLEAGSERDEEGRPTRFWARAEILEGGEVVKSRVIEPNHPLRHRGVNAVLQSLSSAGYQVKVTKGESTGLVPVVFAPDGSVAMMETVRLLEDPPWIAFIHDFRATDENGEAGLAAQVFVDPSGQLSHSWERIGWVDEEGLTVGEVRFRLVPGGQSAQLLLDRDIGVPYVWAGFCLVTLGGIPLLGLRRRAIVGMVSARGDASSILIGGSDPGTERDVEKVIAGLGVEVSRTERERTEIREN